MVERPKQRLTAAHIRKIKETYRRKELAKQHAKIMHQHWLNKKHEYNKQRYRAKLSKAKVGDNNPNSVMYKKKE